MIIFQGNILLDLSSELWLAVVRIYPKKLSSKVSPKLHKQPKTCNFIKKEALVHVFSYEFCEIPKNTFFTKHLWTTVLSKFITFHHGKRFPNRHTASRTCYTLDHLYRGNLTNLKHYITIIKPLQWIRAYISLPWSNTTQFCPQIPSHLPCSLPSHLSQIATSLPSHLCDRGTSLFSHLSHVATSLHSCTFPTFPAHYSPTFPSSPPSQRQIDTSKIATFFH